MKLRRFTKFGMINRAVRLICCLNKKSEKRDIAKWSIRAFKVE